MWEAPAACLTKSSLFHPEIKTALRHRQKVVAATTGRSLSRHSTPLLLFGSSDIELELWPFKYICLQGGLWSGESPAAGVVSGNKKAS